MLRLLLRVIMIKMTPERLPSPGENPEEANLEED